MTTEALPLTPPIAAPAIRFNTLDDVLGLVVAGVIFIGGAALPLGVGLYHFVNNLIGF